MQRQRGNGVLPAVLAGGRKAAVAGAGERAALGRARLPQRLGERALVDVGARRVGVDAAPPGVARDDHVLVDLALDREVEEQRAVGGHVGAGVDARAVARQRGVFLQGVAAEAVVGQRDGEGEVALAAAPAELAEQLAHVRRRARAPAALVEAVAGDEPVQLVAPAAGLELDRGAAERAGQRLHRGAAVREAALRAHRQRAAERVEAEQRVAARHQRDRGQRRARDQVPAHHVAERLVEAHAVEVDRQPLRRAEQRRGGVAAEGDVGLERVALDLVDGDAAERAPQVRRQVDRVDAFEIGAVDGLHVGRHLVLRHAQAGQRADRDDDHRRQLGGERLRPRRGAVAEQAGGDGERREPGGEGGAKRAGRHGGGGAGTTTGRAGRGAAQDTQWPVAASHAQAAADTIGARPAACARAAD